MKKIEQWYDNMNKGQKRFVYGFCLVPLTFPLFGVGLIPLAFMIYLELGKRG